MHLHRRRRGHGPATCADFDHARVEAARERRGVGPMFLVSDARRVQGPHDGYGSFANLPAPWRLGGDCMHVKLFSDVTEFLTACHLLPCAWTFGKMQERSFLLAREFAEFMTPWAERDLTGMAHELVDVCYCAVGTLLSAGRNEIVAVEIYNYEQCFFECVSAAIQELHDGDTSFALEACSAVVKGSLLYADFLQIPFLELWDEVHAANMAKHPFYVEKETGKVAKPVDWNPPAIKYILEKHGLYWRVS